MSQLLFDHEFTQKELRNRKSLLVSDVKNQTLFVYTMWNKLQSKGSDKVSITIPYQMLNWYSIQKNGLPHKDWKENIKEIIKFLYGKKAANHPLEDSGGKKFYSITFDPFHNSNEFLKTLLHSDQKNEVVIYLDNDEQAFVNNQSVPVQLAMVILQQALYTGKLLPEYFDQVVSVRKNNVNGYPANKFKEELLSMREKWEEKYDSIDMDTFPFSFYGSSLSGSASGHNVSPAF